MARARATGQRCKAIRVRGHTCCRMHGGSAAVIKRYREELAAIIKAPARPRKPARLEWLLTRLAKVERNRPLAHSTKYERRHAAEAEGLLAEVAAKGATALARAVHQAAVTLRPYRTVDCLMVSARLALAWGQTRRDIERMILVQEMAGSLGLNADESARLRELLAPVLGCRAVVVRSR